MAFMKKLSKAEEKRLFICRERAFDLMKRMEELAAILRKKEWPGAEVLLAQQRCVLNIHKLLEGIENNQFLISNVDDITYEILYGK